MRGKNQESNPTYNCSKHVRGSDRCFKVTIQLLSKSQTGFLELKRAEL